MRMRFVIMIGLAAIALSEWHFGASNPTLLFFLNNPAGARATIGLDVDEPVGLLSSHQFDGTTTYSDGNYEIQITETASTTRNIVRVVIQKSSGQAFRLKSVSIAARVPRSEIGGIWYPGAHPNPTNVMATDGDSSIDDIADANYGIPYVAAASATSKNVLALGLGRQDLAVAIAGDPTGTRYDLRLKTLTARTAVRFEETFYVSANTAFNWSDVAADYADWVDASNDYQPFPISNRAYEPLYDTWYWTEDRVDERLYLNTAMLASELGVGLFLADSGWDTEEGEYQKWLNGKTGDYTPPATKFSNLPETFGIIRSEGNLGIDLWLQPFAVGRESFRYAATRDMHIQLPLRRNPTMGWEGLAYEPFTMPLGDNLENVNLCPRLSSTQDYLRELFTEMATAYKPEGYWIDFIDGMPAFCIAPHRHTYPLFGEGLRQSLKTIRDTILYHDPEAIVHFRARYANLNTKSFANIWQSGDSPGDFDQMRLNSIRMRPFSRGVVFASDQLYWPEDTPEVQVAKFIMTSVMTGVPAFGPTLVYSPPETIEMMKAWLRFYREHQTALVFGRYSIFGQLAMPNHKIESPERTFAYIRNLDFSALEALSKTVHLMNATDFDTVQGRVCPPQGAHTYSIKIFNRYLISEAHEMQVGIDSEGCLSLDIAVEQGGMAVLTPVEEQEPDAS